MKPKSTGRRERRGRLQASSCTLMTSVAGISNTEGHRGSRRLDILKASSTEHFCITQLVDAALRSWSLQMHVEFMTDWQAEAGMDCRIQDNCDEEGVSYIISIFLLYDERVISKGRTPHCGIWSA